MRADAIRNIVFVILNRNNCGTRVREMESSKWKQRRTLETGL